MGSDVPGCTGQPSESTDEAQVNRRSFLLGCAAMLVAFQEFEEVSVVIQAPCAPVVKLLYIAAGTLLA